MKDPSFIAKNNLSINVPVSGCTAIKTGGNADFFGEATDLTTLEQLLLAARDNSVPACVVGTGSKSVISDHGFRGLLIKNAVSYVDTTNDAATIGSGTTLREAVQQLATEGLGGFESLAALPGTIGGTLRRSGEMTRSLLDRVEQLSVFADGSLHDWSKDDYQKADPASYWTMACTVRLDHRPPTELQTNMLRATQDRLRHTPGGIPSIKVLADADASACLRQLEMAGERVGGAVISSKDPNCIINDQSATSHDIYELAGRMKNRVKVKLGRSLKGNISWIGEW